VVAIPRIFDHALKGQYHHARHGLLTRAVSARTCLVDLGQSRLELVSRRASPIPLRNRTEILDIGANIGQRVLRPQSRHTQAEFVTFLAHQRLRFHRYDFAVLRSPGHRQPRPAPSPLPPRESRLACSWHLSDALPPHDRAPCATCGLSTPKGDLGLVTSVACTRHGSASSAAGFTRVHMRRSGIDACPPRLPMYILWLYIAKSMRESCPKPS
jgi:hypothetical protein